jgi:transposase
MADDVTRTPSSRDRQAGSASKATRVRDAPSGRLLVESAWHYRRSPYLGQVLAARQQCVPDQLVQSAWRAQRRLHGVFGHMRQRGKPANVATVAVARELSGFLWAAATSD